MNKEQVLRNYLFDKRIVLTLDAGGTNCVFGAYQGENELIDPFILPSFPNDLHDFLDTLVNGFSKVIQLIEQQPTAISFGFPGPADYEKGIICAPPNLPAFRDGVGLKHYLEKKLSLPVFINNDGNLFALGEWTGGFLPEVNRMLRASGSEKQFRNLIGITLGTGFGCGIVIAGTLITGDNGGGGEIWLLRNKVKPGYCAEASCGREGLMRLYAEYTGISLSDCPEPFDIYAIACGTKSGNTEAAQQAFNIFGEVAGDAIASVLTLSDGLVVIGGGLSGAASLFLPSLMKELNTTILHTAGTPVPRLELQAFNLSNLGETTKFIAGTVREAMIPDTAEGIAYDALPRTGVGVTRLGTGRAVSIGAVIFALSRLDGNDC
ncbi:MAG: ROK family protein [Spirochaetales bacterium]|nr:ROK family protein [Spirochaetales bacterium]